MALTRRAFAAATAAGVAAPTIARAKECRAAGMDWMTMSLEARNLAYFNVAHVGADFARQKTESWTTASKDLRAQRPKHLDLAYGPGERTKWDLYPAADPKAPCFVHIHGGYWQRCRPAICQGAFGEAGKYFLAAALPVTAVNVDEARRIRVAGGIQVPFRPFS